MGRPSGKLPCSRLSGLYVAREVVNNLRQQTCPVDRVDSPDAVLALELQVVGHGLDHVLAIVKHALDGDVVDIRVHQAEHLRLLEGAHAAIRAGHEDTHALFATHGVLGGAAGVAAGGAQNIEFFATAGQLKLKQIAQQLHGHVLEGQGGAIGQGFQPQAVFKMAQGHDFAGAKHFGGVGLLTDGAQVGCGNVVDVKRQNLERQRRVPLCVVNRAPVAQGGVADLRIALWQVQTAIGRQAFEQNFAKALALGVSPCGEVLHQANSSLRMRTMGCSTVGRACISAMAWFMRAS